MTLAYDPLMRLSATSGGLYPRGYQYDGLDVVGLWSEGTMSFRYVPGPGEDEPVAEYYVPQNRREWFHADERGSIMIVSGDDGTMQAWPRYDEYGNAQNPYGLYGYTGQLSLAYSDLPELDYYKARIYAPHLGRFLQTDPIGYEDSPNLYAYVLNDPVNLVDPFGLQCSSAQSVGGCGPIPVTGSRSPEGVQLSFLPSSHYSGGLVGFEREPPGRGGRSIEIRAPGLPRHGYLRTWRITRQGTQCTAQQARAAMLNSAVPGRYGGNISGQSYDVSWLGSNMLSGPDTIRFTTRGSNGFVNETLSNHFFRYGTVVGWLSGNQQNGFLFSVRGSGTNVSAFRTLLNQHFGPGVFKSAARQMIQDLLSCGG